MILATDCRCSVWALNLGYAEEMASRMAADYAVSLKLCLALSSMGCFPPVSGEYTLAIFHRILKGSHIPVGTTSFKEQECSPITISVIRIRVQVPHCPLRLRTCTVHSLFRSGNGLNLCCSTLSPANPEKTNLEKGLFQGTDEALYRRYKAQT